MADPVITHSMGITLGALLSTLNNPTPEVGDRFGDYYGGIVISDKYTLVAAAEDNTGATNAGSLYVFNTSTGSLLHTLNNPTPADNDYFGGDYGGLAISGNYAVVGAWGDDTGVSDSGSAYIYDLTTGTLLHIFGQGGSDTLIGGDGGDRFILEGATAFSGVDTFQDFDTLEGDVIDINDVLVGFTKGVDDITDFARFIDVGGDTTLEIDADGLAGGVSFTAVALIIDGAGLDAATLETNGTLIV